MRDAKKSQILFQNPLQPTIPCGILLPSIVYMVHSQKGELDFGRGKESKDRQGGRQEGACQDGGKAEGYGGRIGKGPQVYAAQG